MAKGSHGGRLYPKPLAKSAPQLGAKKEDHGQDLNAPGPHLENQDELRKRGKLGVRTHGPHRAKTRADVADGLFDIAVMREEKILGLLNLLGRLHSAGHVGHPLLSFHKGRRVEVRPRDPKRFPVEIDGEMPIRGGFVAEILPQALTIRT